MAVSEAQAQWMTRVLALPPRAADGSPDLRRWNAVRSIWDDASRRAGKQLGALQAALGRSGDAELQAIAKEDLRGVLGGFDAELRSALDTIAGSGVPPEPGAVDAARNTIERLLEHLTSDARVAACDENPFGVAVKLADTLIPALEELDDAIERWARR